MSMLVVQSDHSAFVVKTALERAAFHLRKHGYGSHDAEQADILDALVVHVSDPDAAPPADQQQAKLL